MSEKWGREKLEFIFTAADQFSFYNDDLRSVEYQSLEIVTKRQ